ncbi:MAG: SEC-C metal-binding domain-containing protein, partial [Rhodocyclaceae bacterium]|nr:SEC-C metal-binding domain-containing protein [Rhodocyclaceae bacterium]
GWAFFEQQARLGVGECLAMARKETHHRYPANALTETEWWSCFEDKDAPRPTYRLPEWLTRLVPEPASARTIHSGGTYQRETPKVGRNDPCPCGSGKKFKKCCGRDENRPEAGHDAKISATRRALDWLMLHHSDSVALVLFRGLTQSLEPEAIAALDDLRANAWETIRANLLEWLLAEATVFDIGKKNFTAVSQLLLGPGGPALNDAERRWLEALAAYPLSLYTITHVEPDATVTLVDDLDPSAAPIVIDEKTGGHQVRVGMRLGLRPVFYEGRWLLSGCIYPFAPAFLPALDKELAAIKEEFADAPIGRTRAISEALRRHWLQQFLNPAPLPALVDHSTGERLLFLTDRYRVRDWAALEAALAQVPDIAGDRQQGWTRIVEGADGALRPRLSINPIAGEPDQIGAGREVVGHAGCGGEPVDAVVLGVPHR